MDMADLQLATANVCPHEESGPNPYKRRQITTGGSLWGMLLRSANWTRRSTSFWVQADDRSKYRRFASCGERRQYSPDSNPTARKARDRLERVTPLRRENCPGRMTAPA